MNDTKLAQHNPGEDSRSLQVGNRQGLVGKEATKKIEVRASPKQDQRSTHFTNFIRH